MLGFEGRERKRAGVAFSAQRPGTRVGARGNPCPRAKKNYQPCVGNFFIVLIISKKFERRDGFVRAEENVLY